jgi:aminoglycoside phosphotransferase (APT) family kinase protein
VSTPTQNRTAANGFDILDDPPEILIEKIRASYPVEPENDRLLVRKMHDRASGPYVPATLQQLSDGVRSLLAEQVAGSFTVSDERWFTGGASKIQMGFTLEWEDPARGRVTDRLMVRMDPSESLNATSKLREHQLLGALAGVLPVPRALWVDDDARHFPHPALVYSVVEGVTKPVETPTGQVSGLGTNFGPRLREQLAQQFIEHLATLHQHTALDGNDLGAFARPAAGSTEGALWQLNLARRVWEEDRGEDLPLMEVAANWLERNLPAVDHVSIVHGDYRSGNFLFDEPSGRITAWLDWELAHFGDRHLDLAWAIHPLFGHYAEGDTSTYLISGLLTQQEFMDRYAEATGWPVDATRLHWYQVLVSYVLVTKVIASAYRVVRLGKSHQDILLARVEGMAPAALKDLKNQLEEGF